MIEYLRGILLVKEPDHVVVDAGGVGYGVDVPRSTSSVLPEAGGEVALHIHFHFNEQAMRLFGFFTPQERDIFEVFISISGIGPKTALGILSSIDAADFAQAILREDYTKLTKLPGVGKKTAERLVVELRDKILPFAQAQGVVTGAVAGGERAGPASSRRCSPRQSPPSRRSAASPPSPSAPRRRHGSCSGRRPPSRTWYARG